MPADPFLIFIETDEFVDDWRALGLDVERDHWDLQVQIMTDPGSAPVIPGTGGLRKLRFAPRDRPSGKRGGVRVCYAYFEEFHRVLLLMAYDKSGQTDLSPKEKAAVKRYLNQVGDYLARTFRG